MRTLAAGLCFEYAYHYVKDHGGILVHAKVLTPWPPGNKRRYWHAWVEKGGRIYDWQHAEGHHISSTNIKDHYRIWKPTNIRRYTAKQAFAKIVSGKHNLHLGPWS
jgi:hypothetical protein